MKAVTIADLVFASLRYRPDRIILGEVRGGEAWDLLQALNTGHLGSFSTIHANSAVQAPPATRQPRLDVLRGHAAARHQGRHRAKLLCSLAQLIVLLDEATNATVAAAMITDN